MEFSLQNLKNIIKPGPNVFKPGFLTLQKKGAILKSRDTATVAFDEQDIKCAIVKSSVSGAKEISQLFRIETEGVMPDDLAAKVKSGLSQLDPATASFVGVVPSYCVVTRNIEIPSLDPNEIREIINLQATRHTPYARNEIVIDFLNLGVFKSVYTKILLIIAPRLAIMRFYELAAKLSMTVDKIVFAPEAIVRDACKRFNLKSEKQPVCLIWLNGASSDFFILRGESLLFIRNIPVGAQHFAVAKEAYTIRFMEELKKSFETYQSENIDQAPEFIGLVGAFRRADDLDQLITDILHLPVKRFDDFEFLNIHPEIKQKADAQNCSFLHVISSGYYSDQMVANLVPEEHKLRKTVEERSKEIVKTGILSIVLFGLLSTFLIAHIFFQTARIDQLTKRYEPIRREAQELEEAYGHIQSVKNHFLNRGKALDVLTELYLFIPQKAYFTAVQYDESKLDIKGTSYSKPEIFGMIDKMESSKELKNVQTKYITTRNENEREVADFEVVASFES